MSHSTLFLFTSREEDILDLGFQIFVHGPKQWKRANPHPLQVIFKESLMERFFLEVHEFLGHRGVQAVYEIIRKWYFWCHMYAYVKHHVATCHQCQI